jgi:hypothetical protein
MLFLFLFFTLLNTASAYFPYESIFSLNYFNDSICNDTIKVTKIPIFCSDTNIVNNYPDCCWQMLNDFQLESNSTFDTCYNYDFDSSISFHCDWEYSHLSITEILFVFGLGSIAILAAFTLIYCGSAFNRSCKRKRQNSYYQINNDSDYPPLYPSNN